MQQRLTRLTALGIASVAVSAMAAPGTFYTGDMTPLNMHYGTPLGIQFSELDRGATRWQLGYSVSNTLHQERKSGEDLAFDGETSRLLLAYEYGLSDEWDVRFELPWLDHGAGSLDGFVNDFHEVFGFPEGKRPNVPDDQYGLRYRVNGTTLVQQNQATSGVGDVSVSLIRNVSTDYEDRLSVGGKLDIPTGDEDELTGSGTLDLALWVSAASQISDRWSHYSQLGGVYVEPDEGLLSDRRKDGYAFMGYGIEWRVNPTIALRLQADAQSAIYDSETRLLGHSTALTSGGTIHFSDRYALDIGVTEDVDVGTSSDVVFYLNLSVKP